MTDEEFKAEQDKIKAGPNKCVNGVYMALDSNDLAFISAKESQAKLDAQAAAKVAYLNSRYVAYPNVNQLIEFLYNSMQSGEIPKSAAFCNAIAAVQKQYPAPVANS